VNAFDAILLPTAMRWLVALLLTRPLAIGAGNCFGAPLPPVATVLQRVVERAEQQSGNDGAFNERYRFTRTRVTEYRNAGGNLKKREEKKSEHKPDPGIIWRQARPTEADRSPDGHAGRPHPATGTPSNARGNTSKKSTFSVDDDLLSRFQITLTGRELLNGRWALVLDFQPADKKLPERNLKDRFINQTAGRAWVDEEEYLVTKADLHLIGKVSVVGGLIGSVGSFNCSLNRERTPDGLWFTRSLKWHLEGREVVVKRIVDYHEERSGLEKVR
jgi:hypothetical protein